MKTAEDIKLKWQKHNRDNGMSWNEVAELVNELSGFYRHKHDKPAVSEGEITDNKIDVAYDKWYREQNHKIYAQETFRAGAKWALRNH